MDSYTLKKLTDEKWINLYDVAYQRPTIGDGHWLMCSRKEQPITDAQQPDAVFIVPILKTTDGNKLVMTKEYRIPIWDTEYGFPAGLIDKGETIESTAIREMKEETGLDVAQIHHISMPVYSSAGLSDESCVMVLAEVTGTPSTHLNEAHEDIEVVLMDV
ncbi:MAG: NUDIX domain-containing protein, partial [Planctomycetota bacterium]